MPCPTPPPGFSITDNVGNRCREHPSLFLFRPCCPKNQLWGCILRSSVPKHRHLSAGRGLSGTRCVHALNESTSETKIWVTTKGVYRRHTIPLVLCPLPKPSVLRMSLWQGTLGCDGPLCLLHSLFPNRPSQTRGS